MLPRETSVRQLKMLRKLTKGKDIGDLTVGDRLNHNIPNLQYIGNPVDTGIDSYEEFTDKDSKLQTIAFKSKLVNKPLVKENKKENMKKMNNLISLNEYHSPDYEPLPGKVPEELEPYYLNKLNKKRDAERLRQKASEEDTRRAIKRDLIITAVEELPDNNFDWRLFLAGGITNCPDWQSEIIEKLKNLRELVIFNPRRKSFNIKDPNAAKEQITWEFNHLSDADFILFWFCAETIQPITLLELGKYCLAYDHIPAFIGCDPKYERKQDVEIQTKLARPDIQIVYSLDELAKQVIAFHEENHI